MTTSRPVFRTSYLGIFLAITSLLALTIAGMVAGRGTASAQRAHDSATATPTECMPGMAMAGCPQPNRAAYNPKPLVMTEGPYQMEMLPPSGLAPTWSELTHVYAMLKAAKAANDKYRDVKVAQQAGFVTIPVLDVPTQGAHYINLALMSQKTFDVTKPAVLVYNKVNGKLTLSGAMYYESENSTPQQLAKIFPPSMTSWHRHINNCVVQQGVLPIHDKATCTAKGGFWLASTGWMVHAWLWDKNSGVFDMDKDA